jgi:anti-sigma B factor antagonist
MTRLQPGGQAQGPVPGIRKDTDQKNQTAALQRFFLKTDVNITGGERMKIKQNPQGNVMILELSGKIMGGPDFDKFKEEIAKMIEGGFKNVILDMSGVPWINSTGLGILITGYHSIKAAEGTMKICNVKERVLSIFYISQLENIFDVYETLDQALAAYSG